MQLKYRGSSYSQYRSEIETTETGIIATFLGQKYSLRHLKSPHLTQLDSNLKYRGIDY